MSETPTTPPPLPGTPSSHGQGGQGGARGPQPTIGELIARISENISGLIQGEIDLAKAKGKRMVTNLGLGAALLGAAGVLALFAFGILLGGIVRLLALALPLWASYLIVALVLFIIVAILALLGVKRLKKGRSDVPAPQEGLRSSAETVKSAVASGLRKGGEAL
ncbi:phage holin family protein [Actinomyces sp. zg328]|uniref:phage holin family protein n=1 Tax=Actinomyces sp. zg328 TaxID=2609287 RepID=UPI00135B05A4|nr:phage holin family protein [Actinomyces sp. zg328]